MGRRKRKEVLMQRNRYSVFVAFFTLIVVLGWTMNSNSLEIAQGANPSSAKPGQGQVIVNGVPLNNETVKALEREYGIRVAKGDYWYDRICGAWGYRGGPTMGVIMPFLNLGGPLQSNASNGNTGVFINGRELHMLDVFALQQLVPVFKGRYWIDAQGYFGFEGGPPVGNFWALADTRGVKKEGILSTYDKTGVAVIGY